MEVHAHANTERKKWTHYLWEFFMLFLAVFCGFLAENQREHYMEHKRAKNYARDLISDLKRDTSMTSVIIRQIHAHIRVIDSLASYVKDRKLDQMKNLDLYVLGALDRYRPFMWNRSITQQLINSGSLRYFSNPELINKISAYDAFTHHLDEDFLGDEERANSTAIRRHEVIDMNYPQHFIYGLRNNSDSTLKTDYYKQLAATDRTVILATDIRSVRIFVNDKLNIRRNLYIRATEELPRLVKDAALIIELLKKEYHLK
ncbi:MAG TPA: hypothetical protein VIV35_08460 [Chitinophagaceae bacterium]